VLFYSSDEESRQTGMPWLVKTFSFEELPPLQHQKQTYMQGVALLKFLFVIK